MRNRNKVNLFRTLENFYGNYGCGSVGIRTFVRNNGKSALRQLLEREWLYVEKQENKWVVRIGEEGLTELEDYARDMEQDWKESQDFSFGREPSEERFYWRTLDSMDKLSNDMNPVGDE